MPRPETSDDEQRELAANVQSDGRLITWPDDERLGQLVPKPVIVAGSDHVMVVPRAVPEKEKTPIVVHLLNREYDGQNDATAPQRNFTLRLRRDLFGNRQFSTAMLHAPKRVSGRCAVASDDKYITIHVPDLLLWGLLELGR